MFRRPAPRTLYVRLSKDSVSVRDPRSGQQLEAVPLVTIKEALGRRWLRYGEDSHWHQGEYLASVVNPFASYGSMLEYLEVCEWIVSDLLGRMKKPWLQVADPVVLLHPDTDLLVGATQEGLKLMSEMVLAAGASAVKLWMGSELADRALHVGPLPSSGGGVVWLERAQLSD